MSTKTTSTQLDPWSMARDGFIQAWIEAVGGEQSDMVLKQTAEAAADQYIHKQKRKLLSGGTDGIAP